ncbi:MAG: 3-deoxy-7-phosphoheptulonate synthase [Verrucomicrobiaceae bacterium]|nr:MAG: 3-deoxy-7-phosphoheptulonate synthase [Verrucomicrobiaceae bacterium]
MSLKLSTDDVRISEIWSLVAPEIVIHDLCPSDREVSFVSKCRTQAEDIIHRRDDRLMVVVGPCSIHDEKAALEYAALLKEEFPKHADALFLVMRVYFEKPRTTVGWKGYINDPGLDESYDINRGLHLSRKLLLHLAAMRVPTGTEFLDVISPQYVADLVTWGAIGARTVESQVHRELASGLSMPVGFKNGTGGGLGIALDAIRAAQGSHRFLSVTKQGVAAIVKTEGNHSCHIILRGGKTGANFAAPQVAEVTGMLEKAGLPATIMIDCSHGNSGKDHRNQPKVAADIADQIRGGNKAITGVMIESHLVEGRQDVKPGQKLTYGQSITDACLAWDDTKAVLTNLAEAVRARRALEAASAGVTA